MKTISDIGEFGLIDRITRLLPTSPAIVKGIGDDCAVLRVGDQLLLISVDMFLEDVHFRRDHAQPEDLGVKAAAASLSDIAAMGGAPLFSVVSIVCPPDLPIEFVEGVYRGMSTTMTRFGAAIVGGDTVRGTNRLSIDVTVLGQTVGGQYLRRSGAQTGDLLAVTGRLGLSAGGLHAQEHHHEAPELIQAHRHPRPRIQEGQWLCDHGAVHAMIDISDGLLQDAGHIAKASRLGVNVNADSIPIGDALGQYCEVHGLQPVDLAMNGGEDYELAFAVDPDAREELLESFQSEFRTEIAILGEFTDEWQGVRVDGQIVERLGFDHFRPEREPES